MIRLVPMIPNEESTGAVDWRIATMYVDEKTEEQVRVRLAELRLEHRELDDSINEMYVSGCLDQLQLKRMKKHKLLVKDTIAKLESILIPDLDA